MLFYSPCSAIVPARTTVERVVELQRIVQRSMGVAPVLCHMDHVMKEQPLFLHIVGGQPLTEADIGALLRISHLQKVSPVYSGYRVKHVV